MFVSVYLSWSLSLLLSLSLSLSPWHSERQPRAALVIDTQRVTPSTPPAVKAGAFALHISVGQQEPGFQKRAIAHRALGPSQVIVLGRVHEVFFTVMVLVTASIVIVSVI